MELQFNGKFAVIGSIIAVLAVGARFTTLGESNDPDLLKAVRAELVLRLGARISDDLGAIQSVEEMDTEAAQTLLERADAEGITVHSMTLSKPLLTFATSEKVVVLVEYSFPQGAREREYWLFEHSIIAGWRYRWKTTKFWYYTNVF